LIKKSIYTYGKVYIRALHVPVRKKKKLYTKNYEKCQKKKENCLEYQFLRLTKLINKKYQLYLQKTYARAPTRKKKKIIYIYILKNYEMYQKKIKLVSSYFKINKDSSCLKLIKID
jgi:hypothetical protein